MLHNRVPLFQHYIFSLTTHTHTHTHTMTHPQRAVVGGAEHLGLVRRGDDRQGVHSPHVTRQGTHLLLSVYVPHLGRTDAHR